MDLTETDLDVIPRFVDVLTVGRHRLLRCTERVCRHEPPPPACLPVSVFPSCLAWLTFRIRCEHETDTCYTFSVGLWLATISHLLPPAPRQLPPVGHLES